MLSKNILNVIPLEDDNIVEDKSLGEFHCFFSE